VEKAIVSAQFPRDLAVCLAEFARVHDPSVSGEIRRAVAADLERADKRWAP